MSTLWRPWQHGKSVDVVKRLAQAAPDGDDTAPQAAARQSLDTYFKHKSSKSGDKDQVVLSTGEHLLQRADRVLSQPAQRNNVAAWVRPALVTRSPNLFQGAEQLFTQTHALSLCASLLTRPGGSARRLERRLALLATVQNNGRPLLDTVQWAMHTSLPLLQGANEFFATPVGERWVQALDTILGAALPPGSDRPPFPTELQQQAQSLVPLLPLNALDATVVRQALEGLEAGDLTAIGAFLAQPAGKHWLTLMHDTVSALHQFFEVASHAAELHTALRRVDATRLGEHLRAVVASYNGDEAARAALERACQSYLEELAQKDG